jgi:toxin ParE1/3/4
VPRILKSRLSHDDYLEIWLYVARDSPAAADRLIDRFDEHLDILARAPLIGRGADEFSPGLRSFPVGNYLIFFRPIDDGIALVRLLHAARDITPEFFDEE